MFMNSQLPQSPLPVTTQPVWKQLQQHQQSLANRTLNELFQSEPQRFTQFSLQAGELFLDYSKNLITSETLPLLMELATAAGLDVMRDAMFAGKPINNTEQRSVLHIALRNQSQRPILVDDNDVMPAVNAELQKMAAISDQLRSGEWCGYNGETITDVVNIGIGGSDLGPMMVTEALRAYHQPGLQVHFVSNVDGDHLRDTLQALNPARTLFIVVSKTFTTLETMTNANSARTWLLDALGDEQAVAQHFIAVSTNAAAVAEFGIAADNVLVFWDWVGGRYSLWSAVGLSIAIAIGSEQFMQLLAGAEQMDQHFLSAPLEQNMPVLLALLGVWYRNFWGATSQAILPYSQRLQHFPAFLQQLDMESNGKRVTREGELVSLPTGPIVWGEPGTNGQHAFYQLIHQGSELIPCDFILPAKANTGCDDHHKKLIANCLAQAEALMTGKSETQVMEELMTQGLSREQAEQLAPHKVFPGNKSSNMLLLPALTPLALGNLIALYEHKVFCQGGIWGINSFDQWGVELGKQLAKAILPELDGQHTDTNHDSSTAGLIARLRNNN